MNLSSTVLLSCVLLSGLWGYDESARSPQAQDSLAPMARTKSSAANICVVVSQKSGICGTAQDYE